MIFSKLEAYDLTSSLCSQYFGYITLKSAIFFMRLANPLEQVFAQTSNP